MLNSKALDEAESTQAAGVSAAGPIEAANRATRDALTPLCLLFSRKDELPTYADRVRGDHWAAGRSIWGWDYDAGLGWGRWLNGSECQPGI